MAKETPTPMDSGRIPTDSFLPSDLVEYFWCQMTASDVMLGNEIVSIKDQFSEEYGEVLSFEQLGILHDAMIERARTESQHLLHFFETNSTNNLLIVISTEEKKNRLRESFAIRQMMNGAAELLEHRLSKIPEENMQDRDSLEYASSVSQYSFHDATRFSQDVNRLIGESHRVAPLSQDHAIHQKIIQYLEGLIEYLGVDGGILDLVDRSTMIVRDVSGTDAGSIALGLSKYFSVSEVRFFINDVNIMGYEIKGSGYLAYTAIKNMIFNALDEQSKHNADQVNVSIWLSEDKNNLIVECINDGHFPDEWLDSEGHIVVFGKTTKETGTGTGLQILRDFVASAQGTLTVVNFESSVTMTVTCPVDSPLQEV